MIKEIENTLRQIVDCNYISLTFILFFGILILLKNKRNKYNIFFLLIILASAVWRILYKTSSSRYSIVFIFYSIICYCILLHKETRSWQRITFNILLTLMVFLNIIKCFAGYRDVYVIDSAEQIQKTIKDKKNIKAFLTQKEQFRLNYYLSDVLYEITDDSKTDWKDYYLQKNQFLYGGDLLFIVKEKAKGSKSLEQSQNEWKQTRLSRNITDKKHNKELNLYRFSKDISSLGETDQKLRDEDLIVNGDYESLIHNVEIKRMFSKWIAGGESFYMNDSLSLPKFTLLLDLWNDPDGRKNPHVYAELDEPIAGKSSLHVILNDHAAIYLQNKIESVEGTLTFVIRSETIPLNIQLDRVDYVEKVYTPTTHSYNINIFDKGTHKIVLQTNDFLGEQSLFRLTGSNQNFVLDEVHYYPEVSPASEN